MHALFTRNAAEAWRAANPTPAPAQLSAFLAAAPRPLPCIPAPGISQGALKFALCWLGALALGVLGWAIH